MSVDGERQKARLTTALRHSADDHALLLIALMEAGDLDTSIVALDGLTFLSYAARHRKLEVAMALLLNGAAIDARCQDGATALMWAARSGGPRLVRLLLQHYAQLDATDGEGLIALDYVSCREAEGLLLALVGRPMRGRVRSHEQALTRGR